MQASHQVSHAPTIMVQQNKTNHSIAGYIIFVFSFALFAGNVVITAYWKWTNIINFNVVVQTIRPETFIGLWRICRISFDTRHIECANIDPMHIPNGFVEEYVNSFRCKSFDSLFEIFRLFSKFSHLLSLGTSVDDLIMRSESDVLFMYGGNVWSF